MEGLDITNEALRSFHIAIENIFDNIKSNKSSRDYKWLFILLLSLVIMATAIHIGLNGVGFNVIPIVLVLGYWIYYRWMLKRSIESQAMENTRINEETPDKSDQKNILVNRIRYIQNGLEVLKTRISLIRNQYVLLFPVFTTILIDIIRGDMSMTAFIVTAVIAIILGGLFWIFYFQNDLVDLENASDELDLLQNQLAEQ